MNEQAELDLEARKWSAGGAIERAAHDEFPEMRPDARMTLEIACETDAGEVVNGQPDVLAFLDDPDLVEGCTTTLEEWNDAFASGQNAVSGLLLEVSNRRVQAHLDSP